MSRVTTTATDLRETAASIPTSEKSERDSSVGTTSSFQDASIGSCRARSGEPRKPSAGGESEVSGSCGTLPSLPIQGLEDQNKVVWRGVGKACEWKHPRAPSFRILFSSPDLPSGDKGWEYGKFSAQRRMGRTWRSLSSSLEGEGNKGRWGGRGPGPRECAFPLSFVNISFVFPWFCPLLRFLPADRGGEGKAPLWRQDAVGHGRASDGDGIWVYL